MKLPEAKINIYDANEEWCIIGEVSLRAGTKLLNELIEKYKLLKEKYPKIPKKKRYTITIRHSTTTRTRT